MIERFDLWWSSRIVLVHSSRCSSFVKEKKEVRREEKSDEVFIAGLNRLLHAYANPGGATGLVAFMNEWVRGRLQEMKMVKWKKEEHWGVH